jgi:hypothetical protein
VKKEKKEKIFFFCFFSFCFFLSVGYVAATRAKEIEKDRGKLINFHPTLSPSQKSEKPKRKRVTV